VTDGQSSGGAATANWGDSPVLQATTAWINNRKSLSETGTARFNLARGAINIMKRAYPQYLASGGEQLPRELLTIIYPLSYWDLIKKYSTQNDLDPYLVAALMSQESTFVAEIRSSANAYGLTQIRLKPGAEGAAKITVTARGANLPLPPTPLTGPVVFQAQATNGECWSAEYDAPFSRNEPGVFKANPTVP